MTVAQKASTIATNVGSGAMNIFKVALASTGIGLLVLALASLIGYFTQTQTGIDKLNSVLQPLKAIFTGLYGVVLSLGGGLVDAFSNPKKAMNDLYEFVKQNLINRFTAFSEILEGIINLDFKKVTNGVLQAGTGVENLTGKIAEGAEKAGKFLDENAKKGAEIARLGKEIEEGQLRYNANQIAVNDRLDEQLLISKDTSKSFAERQKASQEIIKITEENGKQEAKILQLKLQQLQVEQSLKGEKNLTNEDKQKTIDLLTQIDAAEDRGKDARLEQTKVFSGLAKEERKQREDAHKAELDRRQKLIDAAIARTQQEIALFQAEQGFRKKSLEEDMIFERQLVEEKQALLKQQLDNKRITETEYRTQNLELTNEYGLKLAEMVAQNAKNDLDLFLENNKSKIDANTILSDAVISEEMNRLNLVSEEKAKSATKDYELGLINLLDYQKAIREIDAEYEESTKQLKEDKRVQDLELKASQLQADNEIALANSQSTLDTNLLQIQQSYDAEIFALENKLKKQEITQSQYDAKVIQADKKKKQIMQLAELNDTSSKLQQFQKLGEGLQGLFGKSKALSSALAGINTALAITEILKEPSPFDPVTTGIIKGARIAVATATGIKSIAEINGAQFAEGGIDIDGPGSGTSDSIPAMLSRGESVITAEKTAMFKPLLKAIHEGRDYSFSNNGFAVPNGFVNNGTGVSIDYDLLANKIANANLNLPAPVVYTAVTDINLGQHNYSKMVEGANH
jgi:hypothetical protein